ncbi:MAG: sugar phosphate isomerase/epimerase family protein [Thermomicrobiales bacterium]
MSTAPRSQAIRPLRLGVSFRLPGDIFPFERSASWIAEHAFTCVMLGTDPEWTDAETALGGEVYARQGLEIVEVAAYTSMIDRDEARRRRNIDAIKRRMRHAEILGARCVASTSGTANEPAPDPQTRTQASWDLLIAATREILDVTPDGVSFCMEAWPPTLIYDIPTYERFFAEIDDPRVGMIFDPANLVTTDSYYRTGEQIAETFDALGERFVAAHCKDIEWVSGFSQTALKEVVPGRSVLDYDTFLRRTAALDHEMPLLIEHLADPLDVEEAAAHIRSVAAAEGLRFA